MTIKTTQTITTALNDYRRRMQDAAATAHCKEEAALFRQASAEAIEALTEIYGDFDPEISRLLKESEAVKQHLISCCDNPGATITIIVHGDDGRKTTAELYDHAAFVQPLVDAINDFQSEL